MRLRCDSPRCRGSITRARTSQEPEGVRAAAAASGWTVAGGAATLVHRIIRDLSPQDRCPACRRRRPVLFEGGCSHCGGMGSLGADACLDCGQHEPGEVPQPAPTGDMTTDMD